MKFFEKHSIAKCNISAELWFWADIIKGIGKIVFWLIIIFGLYDAFISSNRRHIFDCTTFFSIISAYYIVVFIEYFVYNILSLSIGALASINESTKATEKLLECKLQKDKDT